MKLVHCADLHLGNCPGKGDTRFYDHCACFSEAASLALDRGADAVIIAGDLFHQRNIEPRTLRAAAQILGRLKAGGVAVVAIEGNHDKALYTMRQSWMEYLDGAGLLTLLRPVYEDGQPRLAPYEGGRGAVYEYGGVRFIGFGFLGSATRERLGALVKEIPPFDGFTVGLLHTGVDNLRGLDLGAIVSGDLLPYRGLVDYFALGHLHHRYDNGWAFNPGAPECIRLGEASGGEKGYYWLETGDNGAFQATFLPSTRRPALTADLTVTGIPSEALADEALRALIGAPREGLVALRLLGTAPAAADTAAILGAVEEAFSPVWAEVRDMTSLPGAGKAREGASLPDLERAVFAELANEQGLPEEAGTLALSLMQGLLEREPPASLNALLKEFLELGGGAKCE